MGATSQRPSPYVCANIPNTSFSGISNAGSATSAPSTRSGGSRLLFGEIDTSSDRSSEIFASVCSFVQCDSGRFLTFWLNDTCREIFLSFLSRQDLARLRLACHDFSVRAAPNLFQDLHITFRPSTFTKPARLAALDRLGFHVQSLTVSLAHSHETFLPPLVDPESGAELSYTYTPQLLAPSSTRPKYGDVATTEILIRQYPPVFHAATNVSAFVRAFSAFVNLRTLTICCPGHDSARRYRRNVVDFMLISLRIAVEQNCLNALETLKLEHMHPGGLLYLSPVIGYGATPRSASRWSRIKNLSISMQSLPATRDHGSEPDQLQLLQTYLRNFESRLESLHVRWEGSKGPFPVQTLRSTCDTAMHPALADSSTLKNGAHTTSKRARAASVRHFPRLQTVDFQNVTSSAVEIAAFMAGHKRSLVDINLEDFDLVSGTWEEAFASLTVCPPPPPPCLPPSSLALPPVSSPRTTKIDLLELPILLSPAAFMLPSAVYTPPTKSRAMPSQANSLSPGGKKRRNLTSWLPSKTKIIPTPSSPSLVNDVVRPSDNLTPCRRVREGIDLRHHGPDGTLKKVLHRVHWL